MASKKKKIIIAIVILAWLSIFVTDFVKVRDFEKPIFCVLVNGADDGGSGTYLGLGYWVRIEGNFVTENEAERGVMQYDMKLLGIRVQAAIRCLAGTDTYSQEDIQQEIGHYSMRRKKQLFYYQVLM